MNIPLNAVTSGIHSAWTSARDSVRNFSMPHRGYAVLTEHPAGRVPGRWQRIVDKMLCRDCLGDVDDSRRTLRHAVREHLAQSLDRLQEFFPLREDAESRAAAEAAVNRYSDYRVSKGYTALASDVKELLIGLTMGVKDTHRLLTYGRDNVVVRNKDVLPLHGTGAGSGISPAQSEDPEAFDLEATASKNYLGELGRELFKELWGNMNPHRATDLDLHLPQAATAILTGAASCGGYALAFIFMTAQRYSSEIKDKKLEIWQMEAQELMQPAGSQASSRSSTIENELDHEFCLVRYKDAQGEIHGFVIDNWADMNHPVYLSDSHYLHGKPHLTMNHRVHNDTIDYMAKISRYMKKAAPLIPKTMKRDAMLSLSRDVPRVLQRMDPSKKYSLHNPRYGRVTRDALNMTKVDIVLDPQSRPSQEHARNSPLGAILPQA